jgi:hypothetical protein
MGQSGTATSAAADASDGVAIGELFDPLDGCLATFPFATIAHGAILPGFGGVYATQTVTDAVDVERVAVAHMDNYFGCGLRAHGWRSIRQTHGCCEKSSK